MEPVARIAPDDYCCAYCVMLAENGREVANMMGLRDWALEVEHLPPADHLALLTVEMPAERKVMMLRAGAGFWDLDEPAMRHCLVHECGHALLRDLYETVRAGVRGELAGAALRIFLAGVATEKERAVDALATVIAPRLPELDWHRRRP